MAPSITMAVQYPREAAVAHSRSFDLSRVAGTSTGKGILIGLLSAFGSAAIVVFILAIIFFFRYTQQGRIFLDRIGRPGEYDDEQAFAKEEADALEHMDDLQRIEYLRAKAFIQVNPPESVQTDISLSQFLAIQEKGVSAWEFEPELEIANCFVEARTEIEFFDSECSVQSNLPIPKQNEVYYWEAKIYEKPETSLISIGVTTKPYPLFRLPGYHKHSLSYSSVGVRRHNQPFTPSAYGPPFAQGDVIGCGYRPRTGTLFFTRNGKKLDDVAHGLKSHNFFPTVGANGPCRVHVNFGQLGFVFIEANVKKWGLAPMTGSLAPPPPYGSEAGSILLEGGREGVREGLGYITTGHGHIRSASGQFRISRQHPTSPGPQRSPTDISLAQLSIVDDDEEEVDVGEGTSALPVGLAITHPHHNHHAPELHIPPRPTHHTAAEPPPPEYESPDGTPHRERSDPPLGEEDDEQRPLLSTHQSSSSNAANDSDPPIPSYSEVVAESAQQAAGRARSNTVIRRG